MQLEIERRCRIAGIRKEQAEYYQCDDGMFMYTIDDDKGQEHIFMFRTSDNMPKKLRVEYIIKLPNLTYLSYDVLVDNKPVAEKMEIHFPVKPVLK